MMLGNGCDEQKEMQRLGVWRRDGQGFFFRLILGLGFGGKRKPENDGSGFFREDDGGEGRRLGMREVLRIWRRRERTIFGEKRNHRAIMVLGIGVFFELTRERGDVFGYFFFGEKEVMIFFFFDDGVESEQKPTYA